MQRSNHLYHGFDVILSLLDIILQHQTLESTEVKTAQWAVKPLCVAAMSSVSTAHSCQTCFLKHFWPDSSTRSCLPSPKWSKPDFHFCRTGADGNEVWLERSGSLWEADMNQYELWRTYLEKTWRFQRAINKDVPPPCSSLAFMNPSPSWFTWCQALSCTFSITTWFIHINTVVASKFITLQINNTWEDNFQDGL